MEEILKKIIEFTDKAHGDQMRKYSPDRYIVHPVRVMEICRKYRPELPVLAAAILHDVLEDTSVDEQELHQFLERIMDKENARKITTLVVELTDVFVKSNYPSLNRRTRKSKESERMAKTTPDAQTIKYADIIDNSREITKNDPDFARVFLHECRKLLEKMDKGNPELYSLATRTVSDALAELKKIN